MFFNLENYFFYFFKSNISKPFVEIYIFIIIIIMVSHCLIFGEIYAIFITRGKKMISKWTVHNQIMFVKRAVLEIIAGELLRRNHCIVS